MRRKEKQQAIALRIQGKSYNEIRKALNIPSKGTLSFWFKNLQLSPEAKKRLEYNILLAQKRGLFRFNIDRTKRIRRENEFLRLWAIKKIGRLKPRELLLIGAALYWGEGYKSDKNPILSLTNSDPLLISVFLRFLRETINVADERIRTHIHIHPNLKKQEAIQYWADITGLPPDNFRTINQISRASKGRRPKNSLPYGTLDLRVHSRQLHFKVMGFIEGISKATE